MAQAKHARLINFTTEQDALITRAAAMKGVSVSEYIRTRAAWIARVQVTGGEPKTPQELVALLESDVEVGGGAEVERAMLALRSALATLEQTWKRGQ